MLLPLSLALIGYLGFWPVPVDPQPWQAPAAPSLAANTGLANLHTISLNGDAGPEHIALGPDGKVYTGVEGGHILRMNADGSGLQVLASTGGRPLGMTFDAAGNLIVADAYKGLLSVTPDGKMTVLADHVGGDPIRLADGVDVARNGKIYFSDATRRFAPQADHGGTMYAAQLDLIEQSATGRLLEYDPATRAVRVLAQGISFANGVLLSANQEWLYFNETGRYRVWKVSVHADQLDIRQPSPQAQVVLDNLPGFPDNLTRGQGGKLWLGLAGVRNQLDDMAQHPFLRKLMLRVPQALWPPIKTYGHVLAFTEEGKIVADLQDPGGASGTTTGLTEGPDRMYVQSIDSHRIGWLPRPKGE